MSDRHAYLIIAHNEFESLQYLLRALDDRRNDIYIHIDKKTKHVYPDEISSWVKEAGLYFTPRINVYWGHLSIVESEFILLQEATSRGHYRYYHLLSGIDYPLKSQDEIHEFFINQNVEFLNHHTEGSCGDNFMYKIRYYHPFMRWVGRGFHDGPGIKKKILRRLTNYAYEIQVFQEKHAIDRTKKDGNIAYAKGPQWFSITDDFARYVLAKKDYVLKRYKWTNAPDEIFMPTLLVNSEFKSRVSYDVIRHIDWLKGTPYEFSRKDLPELLDSKALFVRKVSYVKNPELVDALDIRIGVEKKKEKRTDSPLVSIVVPVYNVEMYLKKCLDSIKEQSYKNIEVIMVDDGSTDGSLTIAKSYCEDDDRFIYKYQKNAGLSAARNTGIEVAHGEYIAFVDSDDWISEDYVEKLLSAAIESDADMTVCGYIKEDGSKKPVSYDSASVMSRTKAMTVLGNIFPEEYVLTVVAWNKLYKKSIFDYVRFKNGRIHEDEYTIHRIIDKTHKVATITEPLYHYRIRNDSITGSKGKTDLRHFDVYHAHKDRVQFCRKQIYADIYRLIVYSMFEEIIQLMFRYDKDDFRKYHLNRRFRRIMIHECIKYYGELDKHQKREYLKAIVYPFGYRECIRKLENKRNV